MKHKGMTKRQRQKAGLAVPNPELTAADQLRRRSSAARPHDSRPHRQRSRAASKRAAAEEF